MMFYLHGTDILLCVGSLQADLRSADKTKTVSVFELKASLPVNKHVSVSCSKTR